MALIPNWVSGRDGPASRPTISTTIVIAVAMRKEAEVESAAVMVAMLEARHLVAVFIGLGAAP